MRALVMTYLLCYGALEIVCVLLLLRKKLYINVINKHKLKKTKLREMK